MALSYNIDEGFCHLNHKPHPDAIKDVNSQKWRIYENLFFEHSDTCPSRKNRLHSESLNQKFPIAEFPIKLAVCSYLLDKDLNLLLTKRPSTLSIFPQAWVLPGGIVDYGESLEYACLREIEEEIGITIEPEDETKLNTGYYLTEMFSHEKIKTEFQPFYLYESVTKNIDDFDEESEEQFPPKS